MATKTKKIKAWRIEAAIQAIEEGVTTLDKIADDRLRAKVEQQIKASARHQEAKTAGRDTITLTGRIKRETENAVLFSQKSEMTDEFFTAEAWWPKSQINVVERAIGPCDQIQAPRWLVEKKQNEANN